MIREHFQLNRRQFLKVSGAFATIEFEDAPSSEQPPEQAAEPVSGDADEPLAAFARRLPSSGALNTDSHVEFSLTRLDGPISTTTEPAVSTASAYATMNAGRTATDIAFDLDDRRAFRNRLTTDGYEQIGTHHGWPVFHRRTRTRHRVVATTDDAAIMGTGPVPTDVRNDVHETVAAVSGRLPSGVASEPAVEESLNELGLGTHLAIDLSPDPRQTAAGVVTTGERYRIHGDSLTVRSIALFETPAAAREVTRADFDPATSMQRAAATTTAVDRHGRVVVQDATIPLEALPSRP